MAALSPAVTGSVVTYAVVPALPTGITINATTGVISGTPTAISAAANYQVTATNGAGSTHATVTLTVNDTAPDISYPQAQLHWSTGTPVNLTPTSNGGTVLTWTIDPELPPGINLDAITGVISGTPSTANAEAGYTVTASNSGGTDTFALTLGIQNGVLMELGHADGVIAVAYDGQRVLSTDNAGRAILRNAQTREILAVRSGVRHTDSQLCWTSCNSLISLQDNTAVVQTQTSLVALDASDGSELAVIPFEVTNFPAVNLRWWALATDGSYIVTASDSELKIWSRTGAVIATKTNNYLPSKAYATPDELRIGNTAAAANVIERIAIPSGTSTLSATHQGTFHSWFTDGEKFLTAVGSTVWVYSNALDQLDLVGLDTVEDLTGQGNWFWTRNSSSLRLYAVGNSSAPTATYSLNSISKTIVDGTFLALLLPAETSDVAIIDLAGTSPDRTDHATTLRNVNAFAAASMDDWIVGQGSALIGHPTGATPRVYSYGAARSIAADANTIAVATAAERVLIFDAATRALTREIPFNAQKIALADSGNRLVGLTEWIPGVAGGAFQGNTQFVRVYALATGDVLQQWQYAPGGGVIPVDFSVASAANTLAQSLYEGAEAFGNPQPYERLVTTLANGPLWSAEIQGGSNIFLSPDGSMTAIPVEPTASSPFPGSPPTTNLYSNGTLVGALPGRVAGWLDDSRVVINRMKGGVSHGTYVLDRVEVVSTTGSVLSTPATPALESIQPIAANSFYSPRHNEIFDATTGDALFSSTAPHRYPGTGAVAGPNVVFVSGATVRIEPR
jgi:hypothetical protein